MDKTITEKKEVISVAEKHQPDPERSALINLMISSLGSAAENIRSIKLEG